VLYAGAQDSLMPKVFEKVHTKYFTPYIAILFYTVLGLLFASIGGFKQLAIISGASTLLIYLGVILSTIKLRKRGSPTLEKTFQIPGGIIIPLLAVGVILWLLSNLSRLEIISLMIFIVVFTLIYFSTKLVRKNP
jgi:amino acid transporter